MSVHALPDKISDHKKVWNMFHFSNDKIIACNKKNVCFHSWGHFLSHFIEFVRFGKNETCAEMGLRVLKIVPSQLPWRIRIRQLENLHKRRFIKLGGFNKIIEKLALPGIFTHFGRFSNFCKSALFLSKIQREIHYWGRHARMANHTWDNAKFCVEIGPRVPKNGPSSITVMGSIRAILKTCLEVVSSKLGNFDKLGENHTQIVKAVSPILD